jgi:zinc protease
MKTPLTTLLLLAICRSAGAAQQTTLDTLTISYEVNGLRVIQRPTPGTSIVSVNLYLLGGTRQLAPATAGIERLAIEAASGGTRRYPGADSRTAFSRTGSQSRVAAGSDWSTVGFAGTGDQFDSTWAVFADRVVAPTLDSSAVATARARLRLEASRRREDPRTLVRIMADSVIFAGHPYALDPNGTPESLDRITMADVRRYVAERFVTSRMLLVIVGTVPREDVERAVAATLGTLPRGSYRWTPPPPLPEHRHPRLTVVDRPLGTTYLVGYFAGPPVTSSDYAAFQVATDLLSANVQRGARLENLAFSYGLEPTVTYSAGGAFYSRAIALGDLNATSDSPSLILPVMRRQMHLEQVEPFKLLPLTDYLNGFTTSHTLSQETNLRQADALARNEIYWGDYRRGDAEFEAFRHVTAGQVQAAARYYMRNIQFVYLGNAAYLDQSLIEGF